MIKNGNNGFIFHNSAEQAKELVNACLGETVEKSLNGQEVKFQDTNFDVLKEISNVKHELNFAAADKD